MAVPSYTTDLTDIADLDSTGGTAVEPDTLYSGGRSPVEDDTDFPIQGSVHASLTLNAVAKGGILVPGNSWTYAAGDYIFGWVIWLAPSTINTYANGGLSILLGSSATVFNVYYIGGSDRSPNPYGGWQNVAILPTMTPNESAGTPTAYHYVGAAVDCISKVSKGNPLGFDVFRYGRGEILVDGGSSGDGYATFAGMASANDNNSNMWGLFQSIDGGYRWKGLMSFGSGSLTEFVDANASIVIDNTEWVSADFNRIEVSNASSVLDWTAVNITSLGTTSKGEFEMLDNSAVSMTSCTFTDMGTFVFQSNAEPITTTFRRCGLVTQGGAPFTSCTFDEPSGTVGLLVNSINIVTKSTFNSDGTGHAVNLGTISADVSVNWDNYESGYASSDGSTGNETILVSVDNGITLTINVQSGASTPTIMNTGSGTVDVVSGLVTLTLTGLLNGIEVRIRQGSYTIQHTQDVTGNQVSYSYSYVSDIPVSVSFTGAGIIQSKKLVFTLGSTDQTSLVTFELDPSYIT